MELLNWINRDIVCTCGRTHRCDIACVEIGKDALACVPEKLGAYAHILLVADSNTYAVCGDRVRALLGEKIAGACIFVAIVRWLGVDECLVSESDILDGLVDSLA